jgi:hypothetical protein
MNRQQESRSGILFGVSDELSFLWKIRDNALKYEKEKGISPRTSNRYLKAQAKVDNYFLPKENKAQRKKPKKKIYVPDNDWAY